jgi:hypothetical protein
MIVACLFLGGFTSLENEVTMFWDFREGNLNVPALPNSG